MFYTDIIKLIILQSIASFMYFLVGSFPYFRLFYYIFLISFILLFLFRSFHLLFCVASLFLSWVLFLQSPLSLSTLTSINPLISFNTCDSRIIYRIIVLGNWLSLSQPFPLIPAMLSLPKWSWKGSGHLKWLLFLSRFFNFPPIFIIFPLFSFQLSFFVRYWGLCFFFNWLRGFARCNCTGEWFSWLIMFAFSFFVSICFSVFVNFYSD